LLALLDLEQELEQACVGASSENGLLLKNFATASVGQSVDEAYHAAMAVELARNLQGTSRQEYASALFLAVQTQEAIPDLHRLLAGSSAYRSHHSANWANIVQRAVHRPVLQLAVRVAVRAEANTHQHLL
jgi:hypothetical protein